MSDRIRCLDIDTVCHGDAGEVYACWKKSCDGKLAPAFGRDFRLEDLSAGIIPSLTVVDVLRGGEDYYYRFWGSQSVSRKGFEMTGKYLTEAPTEEGMRNGFEQYRAVLSKKCPLAIVYDATYLSTTVATRQLTFRFPLSGDEEKIDKILTYQNLGNDPKDWDSLFDEMWTTDDQPAPHRGH